VDNKLSIQKYNTMEGFLFQISSKTCLSGPFCKEDGELPAYFHKLSEK